MPNSRIAEDSLGLNGKSHVSGFHAGPPFPTVGNRTSHLRTVGERGRCRVLAGLRDWGTGGLGDWGQLQFNFNFNFNFKLCESDGLPLLTEALNRKNLKLKLKLNSNLFVPEPREGATE